MREKKDNKKQGKKIQRGQQLMEKLREETDDNKRQKGEYKKEKLEIKKRKKMWKKGNNKENQM